MRETIELIRRSGASPAGVLIALDREERGQGSLSATQELAALIVEQAMAGRAIR